MNFKVLIVLSVILLSLSSAFAIDTITSYVVPASVPLNQKVTATGIFTPTAGSASGQLCSFYFLNPDQNYYLVDRATDEYTTSTGRVTMAGFTLTEPNFPRGSKFTLRTECGTASADANFFVGQKQEAVSVGSFAVYPQGTIMDAIYWTKNDNGVWAFFFIFIILAVVAIGMGVWRVFF